jgi:hypothetical protein
MAVVSSYLSIITLNVSGLNSPIKRPTLAKWIKIRFDDMLNTRLPSLLRMHIN